jgi:hypothetical protein
MGLHWANAVIELPTFIFKPFEPSEIFPMGLHWTDAVIELLTFIIKPFEPPENISDGSTLDQCSN